MADDNMCAIPAYISMNRSTKRHFIGSKRKLDKYSRVTY